MNIFEGQKENQDARNNKDLKGEKEMLKVLFPNINEEKKFAGAIFTAGLRIFLSCVLGGLIVLFYIYAKTRSNYRNYFCRQLFRRKGGM